MKDYISEADRLDAEANSAEHAAEEATAARDFQHASRMTDLALLRRRQARKRRAGLPNLCDE